MSSSQELAKLVKRLEAVADRLEKLGSGEKQVEEGEAVKAFDEFTSAHLQPFLDICKNIGGDLDPMTEIIVRAFAELRNIIDVASKSKRPSDEDYVKLVKPVTLVCGEAADYRGTKRRTTYFNHLSGLADGLKLVQWVGVPKTPVPYVKDMVEAARFYHIKVLMEYKKKENGELHRNFVNGFKNMGLELANYVKKYHLTGLTFNKSGGDVSMVKKVEKEAPKKTVTPKARKAGGKANLFAQINKGGVTQGLKHVRKEQKTKYQKKKGPKVKFSSKAKKKSRITGKPSKSLVRDSKWIIENFEGDKNIVLDVTVIKHTVYIYKCDNCNIRVKGKCTSITMDNCVKSNLVFDTCVASCELVNNKSVKVQVFGNVPTIIIDKTDGFNCYLNEKTLNTTFVSSKSSEMNISVPKGNDDYKEHPVPEQYITVYDPSSKKFVTKVSSHF